MPAPASACGGFFCDSSQPVNQSAERIIFTHDDAGVVTAIIQIQYSGPADQFAWVLPVAGSPTVGVSSNLAFQRLQAATNPQYILTTRIEGSCNDGVGRFFGAGSPTFDAAASDASAGPPVTVVDQGSVGPYDYVVISLDPSAVPLSQTAIDWLTINGYDIDAAGSALLEPYLAGGMNLLAFRLTKGNDAGSIRPVTITFGAGLASIPIRPTAVAAVADMGVLVWVLGEHRAVPVNYMSLELNEALINWLSPGSNYNDVVNAAADQAGGQGFVTEMAGDARPLADTIFPSFERDGWERIRTSGWAGRESQLVMAVLGQFGGYDGVRDALAATLPLPEGVTLDQVLACFECHFGWSTADIEGFEPAAFLEALETHAFEPMRDVRAVFEAQPFVTRFYTTMSAAEMTRDPSFDFNATLGPVSNVHNAERVIECSSSVSQFEAPWRVVLPSGEQVRGTGGTWPFAAGTTSMPANARVRRVGTEGEGEVLVDNAAMIRTALTEHNAQVPGPPLDLPATPILRCSAGWAASGAAPAWGLLAVGLVALRRRRR
ncbi:MAG: DUF2330 domain-containing protein [Sandaracinaceae bacterium]|nr:DUF2330 domain-containing protein [Sandaracinaceae bacterium]